MTWALSAQTTVYSVKDGKKDASHFYYFDHKTGKVYECYKCKSPADKQRIVGFTIVPEGNKFYRIMDDTEKKTLNGRIREDRKVIVIKNDLEGYDGYMPTIKDNKIINADGSLMGIIEGKEIYGAAAYVIGLFS